MEDCEYSDDMVKWSTLNTAIGVTAGVILVLIVAGAVFLFVVKWRIDKQIALELDNFRKEVAKELKDYYDSLLEVSYRT